MGIHETLLHLVEVNKISETISYLIFLIAEFIEGNCMGDGWETARQPKRPPVYKKDASGLLELPGFEWSVIRLGVQGIVDSIEVDTHFYRGNYPESCMIEALCCSGDSSNASITQSLVKEEGHANFSWKLLLPRVRLGPDERHFFNAGEFNDVRK